MDAVLTRVITDFGSALVPGRDARLSRCLRRVKLGGEFCGATWATGALGRAKADGDAGPGAYIVGQAPSTASLVAQPVIVQVSAVRCSGRSCLSASYRSYLGGGLHHARTAGTAGPGRARRRD